MNKKNYSITSSPGFRFLMITTTIRVVIAAPEIIETTTIIITKLSPGSGAGSDFSTSLYQGTPALPLRVYSYGHHRVAKKDATDIRKGYQGTAETGGLAHQLIHLLQEGREVLIWNLKDCHIVQLLSLLHFSLL